MTMRTSDMHPRLQSPYRAKVTGTKWQDAAGRHSLLFQISIIDTRTGEQVEGCECRSKRAMRETLWRRMAHWRDHATVLPHEDPYDAMEIR